jgi:hypothetical protein
LKSRAAFLALSIVDLQVAFLALFCPPLLAGCVFYSLEIIVGIFLLEYCKEYVTTLWLSMFNVPVLCSTTHFSLVY